MKPFKLSSHVASHPRVLEVVASNWGNHIPLYHSRSALKLFHNKLKKNLKCDLHQLNRERFDDLPARVKHAYDDLCGKQTEKMNCPSTETFEEASDAWKHWYHISDIENQFYFQKSLGLRIERLGFTIKSQDRNSKNLSCRL